MKDVEILLRGYAFLLYKDYYQSSLTKFLNQFSKDSKKFSPDDINNLERVFYKFLKKCQTLPQNIFISEKTNRFNITLYEAAFSAICESILHPGSSEHQIEQSMFLQLKSDSRFIEASQKNTTSAKNVLLRLSIARDILL